MEPFTTIPRGISIPFKGYPELLAVHSFDRGRLVTFCVQRGSTTMENFQISDEQVSWKEHVYHPSESVDNNERHQTCTREQKCPDCLELQHCAFERLETACRELSRENHFPGKDISSNRWCWGAPELEKICSERRQIILNKLQRDSSQTVEKMLRYQKQHQWPRHFYKKDSNTTMLCRASHLCDSCAAKRQSPLDAVNWKLYKAKGMLGIAEQPNSSDSSSRYTENICKRMLHRKTSDSLSSQPTTPTTATTSNDTETLKTSTECFKLSAVETKTISRTTSAAETFLKSSVVEAQRTQISSVLSSQNSKSYNREKTKGSAQRQLLAVSVKCEDEFVPDLSFTSREASRFTPLESSVRVPFPSTATNVTTTATTSKTSRISPHPNELGNYFSNVLPQTSKDLPPRRRTDVDNDSVSKLQHSGVISGNMNHEENHPPDQKQQETKDEYNRNCYRKDTKQEKLKDIFKSNTSTCTLKASPKSRKKFFFPRNSTSVKWPISSNENKTNGIQRITISISTENGEKQYKCHSKMKDPLGEFNKPATTHQLPMQFNINAAEISKLNRKHKQEKWRDISATPTSTSTLDLKRYNLSCNDVIANVVLHDMFRPMRKLKKRVRRKKFVKINFDPKVVLHDICKVLQYDNKDNISTKVSTIPKTSLTTEHSTLENDSNWLDVFMDVQVECPSCLQQFCQSRIKEHLNKCHPTTPKNASTLSTTSLQVENMDLDKGKNKDLEDLVEETELKDIRSAPSNGKVKIKQINRKEQLKQKKCLRKLMKKVFVF